MRHHKLLTPLVAWICAACVTTRSVAPTNLRPDDRLALVSERPMMLRGTMLADRSLRFDCPLLAVSGRVLGVAGDSIWFDPIASRTLAAEAPGECGSVDAGVLAIADSAGVTATRAEFSAAGAVVTMLVLAVALGIALTSGGWTIRFAPAPR